MACKRRLMHPCQTGIHPILANKPRKPRRQAPLCQSDRTYSVASANKVAARSFLAKRAASIARSPARTLPSALQLSCLPFCAHWQKAAHAPATPCQPPSAALPRTPAKSAGVIALGAQVLAMCCGKPRLNPLWPYPARHLPSASRCPAPSGCLRHGLLNPVCANWKTVSAVCPFSVAPYSGCQGRGPSGAVQP